MDYSKVSFHLVLTSKHYQKICRSCSSLSYNVKLKMVSKTSLIEKGSKHFSLLKNKKKKRKHIRKKQIILIRKHEVFLKYDYFSLWKCHVKWHHTSCTGILHWKFFFCKNSPNVHNRKTVYQFFLFCIFRLDFYIWIGFLCKIQFQ